MRICYIANHGQVGTSNDDEGAIAHALTELGHEVIRLGEPQGVKALRVGADLVLFHKWDDVETLRRITAPKAFWWFDLVSYSDPTLEGRNRTRRDWMERITPHVDLGFLTDGDWVAQDKTGKLHWLPQGADGRAAGLGSGGSRCTACDTFYAAGPPILFTGIARGGGQGRESFVAEMRERYGPRFRHVARGVHGRALADLVAGAQVVVAPDSPVTDRYWSNRVYLLAGFGAFLLHPYCARLAEHYLDYEEIVFYRGRADLHEKISVYLRVPETCREIAAAGLARTLREHLYKHRLETLIQVVRDRLHLPSE